MELYTSPNSCDSFKPVFKCWRILGFLFRHSGTALTALEMHWPFHLSAILHSSVAMTESYSKCYLRISHNQNNKLSVHNRCLKGAFLGKENIAQNSVYCLH